MVVLGRLNGIALLRTPAGKREVEIIGLGALVSVQLAELGAIDQLGAPYTSTYLSSSPN